MTNPAPQLPPWLPHDPNADRIVGAGPQPREPRIASATVNNGGVATATLGPVPPGSVWLIDYLVVTCESAATCNIYDDTAVTPASLLDGTTNGSAAVAPYQPPRYLYGSRTLVAVWSGATPGAKCTLRLEYRSQLQD